MGEQCRIEDLTLSISTTTPNNAFNLTGVIFGGTTSISAKIRTCVINVSNTTADTTNGGKTTGVNFNGTFVSGNNFSFNSIKGCTVNVSGNGAGDSVGMLIDGGNQTSIRDTNVYVAPPSDVASTGDCIGVQTNDTTTDQKGSIQLRCSTIGVVQPQPGDGYEAFDIKQSTPTPFINQTYLSSPGIQVGPGVDLVTKTAGGLGFSVYMYPTTLYYGVRGTLGSNSGFLWPGTTGMNSIDTNVAAPGFYRIPQNALLCGMMVSCNTASGAGKSTTVQVHRTPLQGTRESLTNFVITLDATTTFSTNYSFSKLFNRGDKLHVFVQGHGNTTMHDLTLQLDMF
jgi:hypothetical protein